MKKMILIFVLISSSMFGQTQYGIMAETSMSSLTTTDLYGVESDGVGYGFGISSLSQLWQSADFVAELYFTTKKVKAEGYFDFYDQKKAYNNSKFNVSDINVNFLLNQYIIIPDRNKLNLAVQAGIGVSLLNEWKAGEEVIELGSPIKALYILGASTGTEQLRFTIRYVGSFSNTFHDSYVLPTPDPNTNWQDDGRELKGKLGVIALSVTYYFDLFGNF